MYLALPKLKQHTFCLHFCAIKHFANSIFCEIRNSRDDILIPSTQRPQLGAKPMNFHQMCVDVNQRGKGYFSLLARYLLRENIGLDTWAKISSPCLASNHHTSILHQVINTINSATISKVSLSKLLVSPFSWGLLCLQAVTLDPLSN